jgi:hypothetical protein
MTFPELKSLLVGEKVYEGNALYTGLVDSVAPLAGWFDGLLDFVFGRSLLARHLLAFVIVFIQASYLGIVFANKKAFAENTYIPSLVYVILFSFSFDNISLTPELIASGLMLPALKNLFNEIEFREQRNESIFNLGLYISIASLFSLAYALFIFGAFVTLIIYTRSSTRKYVLLFFGFLLPHLLLASSYYLMDGLTELWAYYYLPNLSFQNESYISAMSLLVLGALPLLFLFTAFFMMKREARLSKYQAQLVQSMVIWIVIAFIQALYSKGLRPQSFISLLPPLTFFISHFLLLVRRRWLGEAFVWILLIGTTSVTYASRYDFIKQVRYTNLIVPQAVEGVSGKRLLVLDDDWAAYRDNKLATPFLNWQLSEEIFSQPDYYDNLLKVYDGFTEDPPEIIRDRNNMLKPFLDRIPALNKLYYKNGIYYNRRSINN